MANRHRHHDPYSAIVQAGITLLQPRHRSKDPDQARQLASLSIILISMFVFGCVTSLLARLVGASPFNGDFVIISTLSLYVLTRLGLQQLAIYLMIGTALLYPALASAIAPEYFDMAMVITATTITLLGTAVLTNVRTVLQVIVLSSLNSLLLTLTVETLSLNQSLGVLVSITLIALLVAANMLIVERKEARLREEAEKLRAERDDWHNLVERLPQPILLASGDQVLYANRAMVRLSGAGDEQDLIARDLSDFFPRQTTAHLHQENSQFTMAYQQTFQRVDGTATTVMTTVRPIQHHQTIATLITLSEQAVIPQEHERGMAMMTEFMSDYVYQLRVNPDQSMAFDWLVGAYQTILGRDYDQIMRFNGWLACVHPEDTQHYQRGLKRLLQGQSQLIEYRVVGEDGRVRWVRDQARPIMDDSGRVRSIVGAAHDISQKIAAESTLQTHVVQQAVVAELGLLALSTDNLDEIFNHSVVLVQQVLEVDFATITLYRPASHRLEVVADTGLFQPLNGNLSYYAEKTNSCAAYALATEETVVTVDIQHESRYTPHESLISQGIVSQAAIVIHGFAQPYGVLCVYHRAAHAYSDDDLYFLQSVANVLGTFIEGHAARQAERDQRDFAEALRDATAVLNSQLDLPDVLGKMLRFVEQVIPHQEACSIMFVNDDETLYLPTTYGFSDESVEITNTLVYSLDDLPLLRTAFETKQGYHFADVREVPQWQTRDDIAWIRSTIITPIITHDRVLGFLIVNSGTVAAFNDQDVERMRIFADKTGNAILNARRAEELEHEVRLRTAELKRERAQLQAILDSTGEGIIYTEGGFIRYANRALAQMTGYTAEDFLDQKSDMLYPHDPTAQDLKKLASITALLADGETWRDQVHLGRRDGTDFDAGLTVSKLADSDDGIMRTVTIVRDISHEKALEAQKKRFIANAAHELRNPISNLNTRLYLMQRKPDQMVIHLELLDRIIKRMNRLVSDLLDEASFEHGRVVLRKEAIILQEVITAVADLQVAEADQKQLKLRLNLADDPIQVLGDATRLEQVFTNLINNAINYTPEGGTITVTCTPGANAVEVVVADTGQGIAPEDLPHIFRPFYRAETRHRGTGLGLHITQDIVALHDGTIRVESILGEGSQFIVTLPTMRSAE